MRELKHVDVELPAEPGEERVLWTGRHVRIIKAGGRHRVEVAADGEWHRHPVSREVADELARLAMQHLALGVMQEG